MVNNYPSNVKATIAFLNLLKVKLNKATVNETLQNHPDWPNLLCISDTLTKWQIPNGAGRINPRNIDKLPAPFVVNSNDMSAPLAIVTQVTDDKVYVLKNNYKVTTAENRNDFVNKWDGVYLIAETNQNSGEPNYSLNRRKAIVGTLTPITLGAAIIVLSFMLIYKAIMESLGDKTSIQIGIFLQYLTMLTGVGISSLLLWYEIDKSNTFIQKVCNGMTSKGNCNAILSSKRAKLFDWLSWGEIGFFYFAGGLINLLFSGSDIFTIAIIVSWLSIIALPYTIYSIYYQWRIAKQWCVLCLIVQALLVSGGSIAILFDFLAPLPNINIALLSNVILLYLLPPLVWYVVKPHLINLQKGKINKRQYLRIKYNTEIFETLLKKQKSIDTQLEGIGIELGNPTAKNTIIKVCSTYCGPCSKAHPKIDKLLKNNPDLKVKIIFSVSDNEHDPALKPVRHLLAIANQDNGDKIHKALDSWYLPEKKDYESFAAQYHMNGELSRQDDKIKAMNQWCRSAGISFTPTIFLNGYQLPETYNIEDLDYFLPEYPGLNY